MLLLFPKVQEPPRELLQEFIEIVLQLNEPEVIFLEGLQVALAHDTELISLHKHSAGLELLLSYLPLVMA